MHINLLNKTTINVLRKNSLTLIDGPNVKKLEKIVSKIFGKKYGLMVNSGSSANLLAFFCLTNPKRKKRLKPRDECIVPALCWSTSLWPIVQSGLKPVLIDVDKKNFSIIRKVDTVVNQISREKIPPWISKIR